MSNESEKGSPSEYQDWKPQDENDLQRQHLTELAKLVSGYHPDDTEIAAADILDHIDVLREGFQDPELLRKSLGIAHNLEINGNAELRNRNRDIVFQSMSEIEAYLSDHEDEASERAYVHQLNSMLLNGTYPQLGAAREALYSRLPLFEKMFLEGDFNGNFMGWMQMMLMESEGSVSEERKAQLQESLFRLCIQKEEDGEYALQPGLSHVIRAIDSRLVAVEDVAKKIVPEVFATIGKRFDIPGPKLESVWRGSCDKVNLVDTNYYLMNNLRKMTELDRMWPGSPKALYERYGILCFSRYPIEVLEDQYQRRNEKDTPYGVVLFPHADHNGAFYTDENVLLSLKFDLRRKALLRVAEAGSKLDLVKQMRRMRNNHGPMSFAILGAHGQKNGFEFGRGTDPKFSLTTSDVLNPDHGAKKMTQDEAPYFVEDPTIILVSCSTGQPRGIAETLSRELNAHVIAPDRDTSLRWIRAKRINEKWDFSVEYGDKNTERRYRSGRAVSDEQESDNQK